MFKTRLLSGIVLVILALVFIITGNDLLLAVTGIISLIGLYELYRVFKIEKSCAIIRIRKHIYATIPFENSVLNYFRKENFRDE